MCGRYTLTFTIDELQAAFPEAVFNFPEIIPRYNVAPSQMIPVVRKGSAGELKVDMVRWGLIPSWAKDPTIGSRMINARAETLSERAAYKMAFRSRRCLIPADGFFEWVNVGSPKNRQPIYFFERSISENRPIFAFAGLWERWHSPSGEDVHSATIITTTPNDLLSKFHDRMPVIIPKENYQAWLNQEAGLGELQVLLKPYPGDKMDSYPVSQMVNSPKNDFPELVSSL
jgi:putative SOS response-associated peptidase YedK